jgi:hypothetical protein
MSAREIIAELERLSPEELREIQRHLESRVASPTEASQAAFRPVEIDGRILLAGPRVIRQSEVEAILADFP